MKSKKDESYAAATTSQLTGHLTQGSTTSTSPGSSLSENSSNGSDITVTTISPPPSSPSPEAPEDNVPVIATQHEAASPNTSPKVSEMDEFEDAREQFNLFQQQGNHDMEQLAQRRDESSKFQGLALSLVVNSDDEEETEAEAEAEAEKTPAQPNEQAMVSSLSQVVISGVDQPSTSSATSIPASSAAMNLNSSTVLTQSMLDAKHSQDEDGEDQDTRDLLALASASKEQKRPSQEEAAQFLKASFGEDSLRNFLSGEQKREGLPDSATSSSTILFELGASQTLDNSMLLPPPPSQKEEEKDDGFKPVKTVEEETSHPDSVIEKDLASEQQRLIEEEETEQQNELTRLLALAAKQREEEQKALTSTEANAELDAALSQHSSIANRLKRCCASIGAFFKMIWRGMTYPIRCCLNCCFQDEEAPSVPGPRRDANFIHVMADSDSKGSEEEPLIDPSGVADDADLFETADEKTEHDPSDVSSISGFFAERDEEASVTAPTM